MNNTRAGYIVLILFAAILCLNVFSIRHKNPTHDESRHYMYGFKVLKLDPSRFDNSKMPISALNALPSVVGELLGPGLPKDFLSTLNTARYVTILFSLILAIYVFKWAREMYGTYAALLALTLYAFSPNMIAHSRLVTTDLYAALVTTVSLFYFWRFLNLGGWRRAALSASALGLAQLAKYTSVFLYPVFVLILLTRFSAELPDMIRARRYGVIAGRLKAFFKYALFFAAVSIVIINIGFLFSDTLMPFGEYTFRSGLFRSIQSGLPVLEKFPVPVPYPYLEGLDWTKASESASTTFGSIYLFGELRKGGFPGYYLYAFLYKVPIAIQLLILFSAATLVMNRRGYNLLRDEVFLLLPALFFTVYFNFFYNAQIGIRFLIVIFPALFIFCAAPLKGWEGFGLKKKTAVVLLTGYLLVSVLSYFPHYISYFNELVWDRKKAYKVLADSNIDWGLNKWYLQRYVEKHPGAVIKPGMPTAGRIVVNINALTGVLEDPEHYRWLRENFEPQGHIAYSYLVYDIEPGELGCPPNAEGGVVYSRRIKAQVLCPSPSESARP